MEFSKCIFFTNPPPTKSFEIYNRVFSSKVPKTGSRKKGPKKNRHFWISSSKCLTPYFQASNSTYSCLRRIGHGAQTADLNYLYCEFKESDSGFGVEYNQDDYFEEFYDLDRDPYQLENMYDTLRYWFFTCTSKLTKFPIEHTV